MLESSFEKKKNLHTVATIDHVHAMLSVCVSHLLFSFFFQGSVKTWGKFPRTCLSCIVILVGFYPILVLMLAWDRS